MTEFKALQFSRSAVSDSLQPHGLQHARLHQLQEPTQTHGHRVGDAIHLILCRPLFLPSSIFPSIRVFSNEKPHKLLKNIHRDLQAIFIVL